MQIIQVELGEKTRTILQHLADSISGVSTKNIESVLREVGDLESRIEALENRFDDWSVATPISFSPETVSALTDQFARIASKVPRTVTLTSQYRDAGRPRLIN